MMDAGGVAGEVGGAGSRLQKGEGPQTVRRLKRLPASHMCLQAQRAELASCSTGASSTSSTAFGDTIGARGCITSVGVDIGAGRAQERCDEGQGYELHRIKGPAKQSEQQLHAVSTTSTSASGLAP